MYSVAGRCWRVSRSCSVVQSQHHTGLLPITSSYYIADNIYQSASLLLEPSFNYWVLSHWSTRRLNPCDTSGYIILWIPLNQYLRSRAFNPAPSPIFGIRFPGPLLRYVGYIYQSSPKMLAISSSSAQIPQADWLAWAPLTSLTLHHSEWINLVSTVHTLPILSFQTNLLAILQQPCKRGF